MAWPEKVTSSWPNGSDVHRRRPELELDQVEPGDRLGDGVLDLEAGVDLEERDRPVVADEELDGAGVLVADVPGERDRAIAQRRTDLGGDPGRGGLLDDLLVPALDRALTLAEVDHVPVGVADDLDLDVAPVGDVGLDEHGAVAERRRGFAGRGLDGAGEAGRLGDHPHASSAAAGRPPSPVPGRRRRRAPRPARSTSRSWSGPRPRWRLAWRRSCRRAARSAPASGRPRRDRRRSPPGRTSRSRPGTRTRGAPRRSRCRWRPGARLRPWR